MNMFRTRLLNVVKALRESKNPQFFNMNSYALRDNSPCCALGHYASRKDLQEEFFLQPSIIGAFLMVPNGRIEYYDAIVLLHFGIDRQESEELFSRFGCNCAQTSKQAIQYIEDFVNRKWPLTKIDRAFAKLKQTLFEKIEIEETID